MRARLLFVIGAASLVAVAGLALAQDKTVPRTKPKLAAPHEAPAAAPAANAKAAAEYSVIGYLERNSHSITMKAGPNGPVYSVKTAAGKVVCENLPVEQLQTQAPEIAEFLKTAQANPAGGKADARLEPRRHMIILSR